MLEIGPGSGNLTEELLAVLSVVHDNDDTASVLGCDGGGGGGVSRGVSLHAVEFDERMAAHLSHRFAAQIASGQFHLHHADILQFLDEQLLKPRPAQCCSAKHSSSSGGGSSSRKTEAPNAAAATTTTTQRFQTVVGNLPYNISSPIFARLMTPPASQCKPDAAGDPGHGSELAASSRCWSWWDRAVVMVQQEFADRVLVRVLVLSP